MILQVFLSGMGLLAIATLLGIIARRRAAIAFSVAAAGAVILTICGCLAFFGNLDESLPLATPGPAFAASIRIDALAGIFLAILGIGGAAAAIFAIGYVREERDAFRPGLQASLLAIFLGTVAGVLAANDAFTFLVAWETMGIASWLLVLSGPVGPATQRAATTYLVMMHIGTAFLLVAFAALAGAAGGSLGFDAMRAHAGAAAEWLKDAAFLAALVGFGTKAGIAPLHVWLPMAHPEAPSHVSSLMSGVMLKTAAYMMIRIAFDFLAPAPSWWGIVVLIAGGFTALVGILYATAEDDLKRLLAYSSMENLGIIFLGLGLAILFASYQHPELATVALVAAVLHCFNHMTFKGLLFFGAGAVAHATGTRSINRMGGLLRTMPWTGAFFLLAALAISALPPLNGFVSEWLLFQSLLAGMTIPGTPFLLQVALPVGAAFFALAGAMSVVCFVKAFGVTFLGVPRTESAAHAHEAGPSMIVGMAILALGIVVSAAFAGPLIGIFARVLAPHAGASTPPALVGQGLVINSLSPIHASMSPFLVLMALLLFGTLTWGATRFLGSRATLRKEETWLCGHRSLTSRMEYTSTAYAEATRMFFRGFYLPRYRLGPIPSEADESLRSQEEPAAAAWQPVPRRGPRIAYATTTTYVVDEDIYTPIERIVLLVSSRLRVIQAGNIHAYLTYIFVTLLVILLYVAR
ncbi:MAG: proton-conducting transporter transmembrane domain-containing protein [Thermoplasmatota archaeon]